MKLHHQVSTKEIFSHRIGFEEATESLKITESGETFPGNGSVLVRDLSEYH